MLVAAPQPVSQAVKVYPNPAADFVRVECSAEVAEFQLFDLQGKQVLRRAAPGEGLIEVRHLPRGLYVYRVVDGDGGSSAGRLVLGD